LIHTVWSCRMFYSNTHKNKETAQRLICYYDLFSQIIRLKKADEQTNVLVLQSCIGHFIWRPAYVLLLLAIEIYHQRVLVQHLPIYLFSCQLHVNQQHNEYLRFNCNSGYANAPQCYVVRILPILFKFDFVLSLFYVFSFVVCCLCTRLVFLCSLCNSMYGCCASALILKNWIELLTYMSSNFLFQTFAVFWMLYIFFWVILPRLNFTCRRFGT
jgi:hypothetical protein